MSGRRKPPVQIRAPRPKHLAYFLGLIKIPLHPILHCGLLPDRRSGFASRLISATSLYAEFAETWVGRSAVLKLLNRGKLSARHLANMGEIQGTPCISRLTNHRKCKSVITLLAHTRASHCRRSPLLVLRMPGRCAVAHLPSKDDAGPSAHPAKHAVEEDWNWTHISIARLLSSAFGTMESLLPSA